MKTKNKVVALVEISIVLCSVFLVALPATVIAAEQTTQKVSAAVTTASEDDFTLGIYGNANLDDTIDMRDITFTARITLWLEDGTTLADANYDGDVNVLDMTQIGLIILGREKELTIVDFFDRIVTLNKPIERIVCTGMVQDIRTICSLGAADKIVGVPRTGTGLGETRYPVIDMAYPELTELPDVGSPYSPSIEVIASLEPDLVVANVEKLPDFADTIQETTGIPTILIESAHAQASFDPKWKLLRFMGYVLNEQERAEELSSYLSEKIDEVTEVTSDIPDDEKPKIYLAFWTFLGTITYTPSFYAPVELAGGINVLAEDPGTYGPFGPWMWQVSKEQIIAWNPDRILIHCPREEGVQIEDVLSDPDLQTISAVKNKDVYNTKGDSWGWDHATGVIECFYMGKISHPEEFADLDVEEVGNEILEEVYGVDGIWTEMTELCELCTWE